MALVTTTHPDPIADPTQATPVEIDTVLADRQHRLNQATQYARFYREQSERYPSYAKDAERYKAEAATLAAEIKPLNAEFVRRGGWNRYYLVLNSNGHVHREMDCNTCFPTTQYGWVTDLSDCDEDAAVVEYGESMCTICFPNAPTNPAFSGPGRRNQEAKDARAAEKAEREAAKRAKQIFAKDGTLGIRYPRWEDGSWQEVDGKNVWVKTGYSFETVNTKVAARNALSGLVQDEFFGSKDYRKEAIEILVEALERHGIDTAGVIERAKKKAARG